MIINTNANDGYPYISNVDIAKPYVLVYPPSIALWRITSNINDSYPYTSLSPFPNLWIEPNLNWTFQSNFDIVRDFGRISNNIKYLCNGMFADLPLQTKWTYKDNVYKSHLQHFARILNELINYNGYNTPMITVPNKFNYTVLSDIETVTYMIYYGLLTKTEQLRITTSLYADDVLHMADWMVI